MFSGVATQFSVDTLGRCSLITMSSADEMPTSEMVELGYLLVAGRFGQGRK